MNDSSLHYWISLLEVAGVMILIAAIVTIWLALSLKMGESKYEADMKMRRINAKRELAKRKKAESGAPTP